MVRLTPKEASVVDVETAKTIYGVGSKYLKSEIYTSFLSSPNGYFNVFAERRPDVHSHKRKLLSTVMSEKTLTELFEDSINEKVEKLMERIRGDVDKYGCVDVYKWNTFYTTDVIGELSFGSSFEMLEKGKVRLEYDLLVE